jgi:hypothetical protein
MKTLLMIILCLWAVTASAFGPVAAVGQMELFDISDFENPLHDGYDGWTISGAPVGYGQSTVANHTPSPGSYGLCTTDGLTGGQSVTFSRPFTNLRAETVTVYTWSNVILEESITFQYSIDSGGVTNLGDSFLTWTPYTFTVPAGNHTLHITGIANFTTPNFCIDDVKVPIQ